MKAQLDANKGKRKANASVDDDTEGSDLPKKRMAKSKAKKTKQAKRASRAKQAEVARPSDEEHDMDNLDEAMEEALHGDDGDADNDSIIGLDDFEDSQVTAMTVKGRGRVAKVKPAKKPAGKVQADSLQPVSEADLEPGSGARAMRGRGKGRGRSQGRGRGRGSSKTKAEELPDVHGGSSPPTKKSFARRFMPTAEGFAQARWEAVKAAFEKKIQSRLQNPSKHEDLSLQTVRGLSWAGGSVYRLLQVLSIKNMYECVALFLGAVIQMYMSGNSGAFH